MLTITLLKKNFAISAHQYLVLVALAQGLDSDKVVGKVEGGLECAMGHCHYSSRTKVQHPLPWCDGEEEKDVLHKE